MTYQIADGSTPDIQAGDFLVLDATFVLTNFNAVGYFVVGFDDAGVNLQVITVDEQTTTWLTASLIQAVWRKV